MSRADELATGLAATRERIERACASADRDPADITLVAVTKFFPASDVRLLHELGVRDVGESRHPEARDKRTECADLDLTWHFIGVLQSNKAAAIAAYADVVHSVDRPKLVTGLAKGADERGRPLDVLLQVDLDPEIREQRGGARPEDVAALAARISAESSLHLRGVMAVAPLGSDPAEAFARLAPGIAEVRRQAPEATWVSAGMSGDLEAAIAAGTTHVRVGAAILGSRVVRR